MIGLPRCEIVPCHFSSEANQVGALYTYLQAESKTTVSYTHLDVYKRQVKVKAPKGGAEEVYRELAEIVK